MIRTTLIFCVRSIHSALIFLAMAATGHADVLNILLLTQGTTASGAMSARVLNQAGRDIRVDVSVREVPYRSKLSTLLNEITKRQVDIVAGVASGHIRRLSQIGDYFVGIPLDLVGKDYSPALFYIGTDQRKSRTWHSRRVIGIPIAFGLPMVCYDSRRFRSSDFARGASIVTIAYGKIARDVSMPDPRSSLTGRAVLISIFRATGSLRSGWEVFAQLDQNVRNYVRNDLESCKNVENRKAAIGFTSAAQQKYIRTRFKGVGTVVMRDGIPIPRRFVAAIGRKNLPRKTEKLLEWISRKWIARKLDEMQRRAKHENWPYDVRSVAFGQNNLQYFSPEQTVQEWAAQYAYKSSYGAQKK